MDDAPKRSLRDTVTQLLVIAILLALIVGAVIFARQYIDAHNSSAPASNRPTYSVSFVFPATPEPPSTTSL
jgi:hypothetical protein